MRIGQIARKFEKPSVSFDCPPLAANREAESMHWNRNDFAVMRLKWHNATENRF